MRILFKLLFTAIVADFTALLGIFTAIVADMAQAGVGAIAAGKVAPSIFLLR